MALRQLAITFLTLLTLLPTAYTFTATKTPPAEPKDIQYIKCQVCEIMTKQLLQIYKATQLDKGKHLKEEHLIDKLEGFTDPTEDSGKWIAKYDLVEQGDALVMVEQKEEGECGRECKTIRNAARQIFGDHDTDIAEKLYKGDMTRAQLQNWLCYRASDACVKKAPPLPKDRPAGPAFKAMDPQAASVQGTLSALKAQGLGGEVYTREEAIRKYMDLSADDDLDDVDLSDLPEGKQKELRDTLQGAGVQADGMAGSLGKLMDQAQEAASVLAEGVGELANKASDMAGKAASYLKGMFGKSGEASTEL